MTEGLELDDSKPFYSSVKVPWEKGVEFIVLLSRQSSACWDTSLSCLWEWEVGHIVFYLMIVLFLD